MNQVLFLELMFLIGIDKLKHSHISGLYTITAEYFDGTLLLHLAHFAYVCQIQSKPIYLDIAGNSVCAETRDSTPWEYAT